MFDDANGDNHPNSGEGLPGVKVTVTSAGSDGTLGTADDVVHSATTNAAGVWSVDHLPPGPVRVRMVTSSIPAGLIDTYDPDGGYDSTSLLAVAEGSVNLEQDFAYSEPATFGDHVWMDTNGNRVVDPG